MDFSLFRKIVDEAWRYGPRSFSLHLFGEPLLYPKIIDAIRYIKLKNRRNIVLLTTNGTRLNSLTDKIINAGPDKMLWTWRPEAKFRPETKEKLRKWGRFTVRIIREITPPEAIEEWKDWPNLEYRNLHNYGGDINLQQYGVQNMVNKRWPCYHLWLAPAVSWNGDILLCCADPHKKEILGHFPEQTVGEVWKGNRLKVVREGHLKGDFRGICKDCDVWKQFPSLHFSWQYTTSSSSGSGTETPSSSQPLK